MAIYRTPKIGYGTLKYGILLFLQARKLQKEVVLCTKVRYLPTLIFVLGILDKGHFSFASQAKVLIKIILCLTRLPTTYPVPTLLGEVNALENFLEVICVAICRRK